MKKYQSFSSENVQDLEVKFSIYLNRRVFVMLPVYKSSIPCKRKKEDSVQTAISCRLKLLYSSYIQLASVYKCTQLKSNEMAITYITVRKFSRRPFGVFSKGFNKVPFKQTPSETICMKYQSLFSGKNKKKFKIIVC